MITPIVTHELVCTRCGTNVWKRCGSINDRCWCGGFSHILVTAEAAQFMRKHTPSDDLIERMQGLKPA